MLRNPPAPRLTNTDGEPLAPTKLYFRLTCLPADTFDALKSLNAPASDVEILESAKRDPSGALRSFRLDWVKPGNRTHRDWDYTLVGRLEVDGVELTADVNSNRRASRIRREIERRLAGRVTFVLAVIDSAKARLEATQASRETLPPDPDPELIAFVASRLMQRVL